MRPNWVTFSARSAAIMWLAIQIYYATLQLSGMCAISAFAHLGGAATGAICWWMWRDDKSD